MFTSSSSGAERHAPDLCRVPFEAERLRAGFRVPHFDGAGVVSTSADDPPAVPTECHAVDTVRVPF